MYYIFSGGESMVIVFWIMFGLLTFVTFSTNDWSKTEALMVFLKEVITIFVFLPFAVWGISKVLNIPMVGYWEAIYNTVWIYWILAGISRGNRL